MDLYQVYQRYNSHTECLERQCSTVPGSIPVKSPAIIFHRRLFMSGLLLVGI